MSKNFKMYFANFALFTLAFSVLYFNMLYMPSLLDGKQRNIEGLKSIMGIKDDIKLSEVKYSKRITFI
jgi:hypothetical protein